MAWSPDGSKLATASGDKTVKVWESATARLLFTLEGYQASVDSVAWSHDSRKLATASEDGTGQVYAVDHADLMGLVRARGTRFLIPEECQRYLNSDQCPDQVGKH